MSELLGLTTVDRRQGPEAAMPSAAGMHVKLVKADFHGSIMTGQSFFPPESEFFFFLLTLTLTGYDDKSAQKQKCLVSWRVWYHCARDREYVQGRDAKG